MPTTAVSYNYGFASFALVAPFAIKKLNRENREKGILAAEFAHGDYNAA